MPNHGNICKDLNGANLSIKGKRVLDAGRNLKVNTLKTNELSFGNRQSVTSAAFGEFETTVTLNATSGFITTPTATSSPGNNFELTLTNDNIDGNKIVMAQVVNYTGNGEPVVTRVTTSPNTAVIRVYNASTTNALNSAVKISFIVM